MRWTLVRFPRAWGGRVHATASVLLYGLLAVLVFWSAWRAPAVMSIGFGPDPRLAPQPAGSYADRIRREVR